MEINYKLRGNILRYLFKLSRKFENIVLEVFSFYLERKIYIVLLSANISIRLKRVVFAKFEINKKEVYILSFNNNTRSMETPKPEVCTCSSHSSRGV